jgi:hypothetical protein
VYDALAQYFSNGRANRVPQIMAVEVQLFSELEKKRTKSKKVAWGD